MNQPYQGRHEREHAVKGTLAMISEANLRAERDLQAARRED